MLDKLTFEIQESPVLYEVDGTILTSNKHKVLSRSDNNLELSTVKKTYCPTTNEHFMRSTEKMVEISGFEFAGYSEFSDGRVVIAHLKNNLYDSHIGGHKIADYLILGSSCDMRFPFFIGDTTVLLRCENQFSKISKIERVRHTSSCVRKVDELIKSLEIYFKSRKIMYENFDRMINYKIDPHIKNLAIDYVLKISEEDRLDESISTRKANQLEALNLSIWSEMSDLGHNLWGLFNGVTKYTTHTLKQKNPAFGNIFGTAADINNRAYNFSVKQLQLV